MALGVIVGVVSFDVVSQAVSQEGSELLLRWCRSTSKGSGGHGGVQCCTGLQYGLECSFVGSKGRVAFAGWLVHEVLECGAGKRCGQGCFRGRLCQEGAQFFM